MLDKVHRQQIIHRYNAAYNRNGFHANALLWSSQEVQALRFAQIAEVGFEQGDTLLDVGCGFGDLSAFLKQQKINIEFTGIDICESFINEGRHRYPNIQLELGDLFDYNPKAQSFDYLSLSGTLNNKLNDEGKYAHQVIKRLFETCRKGIAFNLLDARHEWTAKRWDLESFHPDNITTLLKPFATRIEVIDGYLENDFTVLAWR